MQHTAREFSAFQANSIKDSKTLLIMKPGSVKKNHQCRSQPEVVTKPRRAQTNQIVCFLNQQIINCNTGGQKTTQWAKKGVTKNQIFTKLLLVKEGQNNFKYWWSRNHAVCKEIWLGEPLEPSRTINESTGGHKTTQCEKNYRCSLQPENFQSSKRIRLKIPKHC